jgi:hypothetical protein
VPKKPKPLIDLESLTARQPRRGHFRPTMRTEAPLDLSRSEANGIADFLISHTGVISAAKELLLKSGPDDARQKLAPVLDALVRHLATIGVTEHAAE